MIFLRLSPSPPLPPPLCKRWGLPPPYPNGKRVAGREGLKCLSHLFDCIVPPLFLSRDGMGLFCRVNGGGRARDETTGTNCENFPRKATPTTISLPSETSTEIRTRGKGKMKPLSLPPAINGFRFLCFCHCVFLLPPPPRKI